MECLLFLARSREQNRQQTLKIQSHPRLVRQTTYEAQTHRSKICNRFAVLQRQTIIF